MAGDQIDFLRDSRQETRQQSRQKKTWRNLSLVGLAVYCLAAGAIFVYSIYLGQAAQAVDRNITAQKAKVAEFEKTEALQILLQQRLTAVAEILAPKTPDYRQTTLFLNEISPEGLAINSYHYSSGGEVNLEAEATNSLVADDFLNRLKKSSQAGKYFGEIILTAFNREADGSYKISLSMSVNEDQE